MVPPSGRGGAAGQVVCPPAGHSAHVQYLCALTRPRWWRKRTGWGGPGESKCVPTKAGPGVGVGAGKRGANPNCNDATPSLPLACRLRYTVLSGRAGPGRAGVGARTLVRGRVARPVTRSTPRCRGRAGRGCSACPRGRGAGPEGWPLVDVRSCTLCAPIKLYVLDIVLCTATQLVPQPVVWRRAASPPCTAAHPLLTAFLLLFFTTTARGRSAGWALFTPPPGAIFCAPPSTRPRSDALPHSSTFTLQNMDAAQKLPFFHIKYLAMQTVYWHIQIPLKMHRGPAWRLAAPRGRHARVRTRSRSGVMSARRPTERER